MNQTKVKRSRLVFDERFLELKKVWLKINFEF